MKRLLLVAGLLSLASCNFKESDGYHVTCFDNQTDNVQTYAFNTTSPVTAVTVKGVTVLSFQTVIGNKIVNLEDNDCVIW